MYHPICFYYKISKSQSYSSEKRYWYFANKWEFRPKWKQLRTKWGYFDESLARNTEEEIKKKKKKFCNIFNFHAIKITPVWYISPPSLIDMDVSQERAYCIIWIKVSVAVWHGGNRSLPNVATANQTTPCHIPEDLYYFFLDENSFFYEYLLFIRRLTKPRL